MDAAECETARLLRNAIRRGEADHHFPASVSNITAQAGEPDAAAADDAGKLPGGDRQIRCDDHDTAALVRGILMDAALDLHTHRLAVDAQVAEAAVIGLHQHAEGESFAVDLDHAGGRADAALQVMAGHPLARADVAFSKLRRGSFDGCKDVFRLYGALADVVQGSVVALTDDRIDGRDGIAICFCLTAHILHHRVVHFAHIEGIGQRDGRFQRAKLCDLHQTCRFAKAVEHMLGSNHFPLENIIFTGQNDGHAGLVAVIVNGAMAHANAGNVADGIQLAMFEAANLQIHAEHPPE